jgi:hypothetical protein
VTGCGLSGHCQYRIGTAYVESEAFDPASRTTAVKTLTTRTFVRQIAAINLCPSFSTLWLSREDLVWEQNHHSYLAEYMFAFGEIGRS